MIAALTKMPSRTSDIELDVEALETLLIFCGAGLAISLAAMTFGLNLGQGLF